MKIRFELEELETEILMDTISIEMGKSNSTGRAALVRVRNKVMDAMIKARVNEKAITEQYPRDVLYDLRDTAASLFKRLSPEDAVLYEELHTEVVPILTGMLGDEERV